MLGGKSIFWARMSFRLSDYEFKAKDHDGFGDNWPISHADLAPFYDRVEPIFRVQVARKVWRSFPTAICRRQIAGQRWRRSGSRKREAARDHVTKIRRVLGDGSSPARSICFSRMPWRRAT